jgi:Fe-S oxidoreductase/FAD/FMN-containing dehydrogenase
MAAIAEEQREFLARTFGARVTFDPVELPLYGHDVGELPSLVRPLMGTTVPRAVVQPVGAAELSSIAAWASASGVPLTARGKATAGYGGAIPVGGAVVVDFRRMCAVRAVDAKAGTVTVEPGITWEQLDRALAQHGLTLRLYPTSYPAATVGGWLAQGGAGIGSFEFGWFRENVVKARAVLATGEEREFTGADIDLLSEACGATGLVSEVTLRVQPAAELAVTAASFPDAAAVQRAAEDVIRDGVHVWSMIFINPRMAQMKNRSAHGPHTYGAEDDRVTLPETHVAVFAFRAAEAPAVRAGLDRIVAAAGGQALDERIARHEWDGRFKVMQVKQLGPSLVPAEVVVPLRSLAAFMAEVGARVTQPVVKEGIVVRAGRGGEPEVVILGFIPSDQRRLTYAFVFSLSLSITRIAEKHGGRAYSTGLYFSTKAGSVLGKERRQRMAAFAASTDPGRVMNPGKAFEGSAVATVIGLAASFEPLTRMLGNHSRVTIGERITGPVRGIPAEIVWHAYSCSQCGYCVDTCDQFYGRGWESQSPRGKWYWLRRFMEGKEKWSQEKVDTFLVCTTCERCNLRCPESLPIESSWMKLRGRLVHEEKRMTFPPFEMMAAATTAQGNIWAGYQKDRTAWFPSDLVERHGPGRKGRAVYFAGCTASYVENDIAIASARLLDAAGVDFVHLGNEENCCGTPMLVAGKWDVFAESMKKNISLVKAAGADTVITSCPACDMMWRHAYAEWSRKLGIPYDITTRHYSEVVAEKIKDGTFAFPKNGKKKERVTWHDSCHIGRVSGVYEPPRDLIRAIPGVELVEMSSNRDNGKCCGSVLTLIKEPLVAAEIGKERLDEALEAGVEKVLALCPCCQFQLRVSAEAKKLPVEIVDLSRYAADALGHTLPDPNPEVRRQWAVFEAMIALMTPKGFAGLMGTMFDELVGAMPLGMGPMMRFMGRRAPFLLDLMKPVFPVLFPILLPGMMPKVMSTMLARVGKMVPMPAYMQEQMPDLMPKVMDNLMPHMINDVVPLVTQPLIDHLKAEGRRAIGRPA